MYLNEIPKGWYEYQKMLYVPIDEHTELYRIEGKVTQYFVNIDGYETPIPKSFFESVSSSHEVFTQLRYKYLDKNYHTYEVIKDLTVGYIWTKKDISQ